MKNPWLRGLRLKWQDSEDKKSERRITAEEGEKRKERRREEKKKKDKSKKGPNLIKFEKSYTTMSLETWFMLLYLTQKFPSADLKAVDSSIDRMDVGAEFQSIWHS